MSKPTCLWCKKSEYLVLDQVGSHMEKVVLAFGICDRCRHKTIVNQTTRTVPIRKAKNPKKYKYLNVNY